MTVSVHIDSVAGVTPRPPLARAASRVQGAGEPSGGAAAGPQESSPIVLVPGVLWLTYTTTTTPSDNVTLYAYLFGAKVNKLSGDLDLSAGTAKLSEDFDIDIFGQKILDGHAELDVDSVGIKASGDLEWLGKKVLDESGYLFKWPWASAAFSPATVLTD
jgi:hypothetical protein